MRKRNSTASTLPLPRSRGLIVRKLDGETLVYDKERDRATCLNAFAAEVWDRCDGSASAAEIAQGLADGADASVDDRAVWLALDQLSREKLLQEPVAMPPAVLQGRSRRELLRALGVGAAAAVPAVTSIMVPSVADAQSVPCFPDGSGCVVNSQCCSFNCNSGVCGPELGRPGPGGGTIQGGGR